MVDGQRVTGALGDRGLSDTMGVLVMFFVVLLTVGTMGLHVMG